MILRPWQWQAGPVEVGWSALDARAMARFQLNPAQAWEAWQIKWVVGDRHHVLTVIARHCRAYLVA